MYRGSRLAASFLLVLTGFAATAAAIFVVPPAVGETGARILIPVAIAFAILHLAALVGVYRARDWGRNLAVFLAEIGGGLAILAVVAMAIGVKPLGSDLAAAVGFVGWWAAMYALLGIAAGRVPVLARLTGIERQRAVLGPSFAGMAHAAL
jgi:hypothetical protein